MVLDEDLAIPGSQCRLERMEDLPAFLIRPIVELKVRGKKTKI